MIKANQIQLSIEIPEEDIKRLLEDANLMQPVEAGFSAVYASDVEHGTPPGREPPYEAIHFWVRKKLNITDPAEAEKVTAQVIDKIYTKGTRPQPYFAPAVQRTSANLHKLDVGREGLYVVAQDIIDNARDNIVEKGISHTGHLELSRYTRRKP